MSFFHIAIIIGLARLLLLTERPFLLAGIYATLVFIMGVLFSVNPPFLALAISGIISFVLASVYFWLLAKYRGVYPLYWVIFVGGFFIGLV